ncbi:hypothetical protein IWQ62_002105, partial [Dispira parvispora]
MFQYFKLPAPPAPIPVESLPLGSLYPWVMHWKTPLIVALIYSVTVTYCNTKQTGGLSRVQAKQLQADKTGTVQKPTKSRGKSSPWFTAFIFLHNLTLCIYSGITFAKVAPVMYQQFTTQSFYDAMCDTRQVIWKEALFSWGYLFYLSKFYEIIDTIIILLKGRKSSMLQTYHHSGAMLCMWAGIHFQSMPIWIFVVFNSFVHTIMYFYYMCTSVGIHPPGKKYITTMQISQFLVGIALANSYLFLDGCLQTQ